MLATDAVPDGRKAHLDTVDAGKIEDYNIGSSVRAKGAPVCQWLYGMMRLDVSPYKCVASISGQVKGAPVRPPVMQRHGRERVEGPV